MTRVNPKIDIAFKKIFGVEENKDLLISLINSIVSKEDQVNEITLLNPYNIQSFKNDKLSILDVKAKNKEGKRYNIEIQIADEADYDKRALYYWAKLYTEQLKESEDYKILNKAIGIHILNFTSITENDNYHNTFHVVEKETKERYFKDLELHTIELNKFKPKEITEVDQLLKKIKHPIDIWIAFLTKYDILKKDNLPTIINKPELNKALNVIDRMSFDDEEKDAYEGRLKWIRMETGILDKEYEKGIERGMERGMEKGRIEIARNLLASNLSTELISSATGLSVEQIKKLR